MIFTENSFVYTGGNVEDRILRRQGGMSTALCRGKEIFSAIWRRLPKR